MLLFLCGSFLCLEAAVNRMAWQWLAALLHEAVL
jgi:hypothetical protein